MKIRNANTKRIGKLKGLRIKKLKIYVNTENQKDGFEKKIKIIMIQRV